MARVTLRVLGEPVTVETPDPTTAIRLDEVLPFLRAIDDRVIDIAVRRAAESGERVSCRKGCAACCKAQPVPVTPAEAYALTRLVEALPPTHQQAVRARFADRVERLREAGLVDVFFKQRESISEPEARSIAERYFQLRLACPFLDDDSCGIYSERPFVCRQYLVSSPAALCDDPFHNPVKPLAMPIAAATANLQVAEELTGRPQYTVPLVLALEYVKSHRMELEKTFEAAKVFELSVHALSRRDHENTDRGPENQQS